MKIEIKHRYDNSVLFALEVGSLKLAVEAAVKSHADLGGADLGGANLRDAKGIIDGGSPDGWRAVAWQKDGAVLVKIGCHVKTFPDARAYWIAKDNRREIIAFLDYAERVAEIRGWPAPAVTPSAM